MHTHIIDLKLHVVFEVPSHQSWISQASAGYFQGLYYSAGIFQANLQTLLEWTYMALFLFHLIWFLTHLHGWNYVGGNDCANLSA